MKNKFSFMKIVMFFLIIIGIGFVNADGEQLSFDSNGSIDIKSYCFDSNKSFCASGTHCQISLFYPNSTILIDNGSMSRTNDYYNYSTTSPKTLGVYKGMIHCISGSVGNGYKDFKFYVGKPSTYVQGKITSTSIYILFGVAILLFLGFLFTPKEYTPFKWTFFLLSILFMVISINVVSISLWNEAGNENLRNIFDTLGAICYYMYWFIGGLFLMIWILTFLGTLADKKSMKKAMEVGMPMRMKY